MPAGQPGQDDGKKAQLDRHLRRRGRPPKPSDHVPRRQVGPRKEARSRHEDHRPGTRPKRGKTLGLRPRHRHSDGGGGCHLPAEGRRGGRPGPNGSAGEQDRRDASDGVCGAVQGSQQGHAGV